MPYGILLEVAALCYRFISSDISQLASVGNPAPFHHPVKGFPVNDLLVIDVGKPEERQEPFREGLSPGKAERALGGQLSRVEGKALLGEKRVVRGDADGDLERPETCVTGKSRQ